MSVLASDQLTRPVEELAAAAKIILHCADDYAAMKQAAERMYAIYSALSGITADDCTTGTIMLPSGKAIAPGAAAHCLLEFRRTAVFLRGIHQAIDQVRRKKKSGPVRILYAGCGPYATLLTPLFTRFTPAEVQADLLDINPVSLRLARTIIEKLGVQSNGVWDNSTDRQLQFGRRGDIPVVGDWSGSGVDELGYSRLLS